MGLVTCTTSIAVAAALRKAEAAAAVKAEAAEALMEAVEGDDLAVLEDALAQAREKGVEDLSTAEARRAELKELAAAAAPAPAEGEEGEAEAGEAEEEAEAEEPAPPPPLQARGEALLQLPEAVVNYESEDEEAEEEEERGGATGGGRRGRRARRGAAGGGGPGRRRSAARGQKSAGLREESKSPRGRGAGRAPRRDGGRVLQRGRGTGTGLLCGRLPEDARPGGASGTGLPSRGGGRRRRRGTVSSR